MKNALYFFLLLLLTGFTIWLFFEEEAAKPGRLLDVHAATATCQDCHLPWQGARAEKCLGCHRFPEPRELAREIRFHAAEKHCPACHLEHRGPNAEIAAMDHTVLHPDLQCAQCHFDPHEGRFGQFCRQCHRITTWRIKGYRHPPAEEHQCARCHRPPLSHQDPAYWERLAEHYDLTEIKAAAPPPAACWRCHVPHDWRHLLLEPVSSDG